MYQRKLQGNWSDGKEVQRRIQNGYGTLPKGHRRAGQVFYCMAEKPIKSVICHVEIYTRFKLQSARSSQYQIEARLRRGYYAEVTRITDQSQQEKSRPFRSTKS